MRVLTSAKQYSNLLTAGSNDGRFVLSAQSAEAPGKSVKRKQARNIDHAPKNISQGE